MILFQKSKPNFIYLYQHVPKCAGTTIIQHLEKELKNKALNLEKKYQYKNEVWGHLVQNKPNLDRLTSIHGHRVFYGLHHIVERKPRYYTFLRNPVSRVISLYNFWADSESRRAIMFRDGKLIPFRDFLDTVYAQHNTIRFLYYAMEGELTPGNEIDNINEYHLEVAKSFLEKCWFIGFVESFAEDFQFLSSSMGIPFAVQHQNPSKKYFELSQDPTVKDKILEVNRFDVELFEYAKQLRYGTSEVGLV